MTAKSYYEAVGSLTAAAVLARNTLKTDPRHARKVLEDAVRDMEPHLHCPQTRAWVREELKR